MAERDISYRHPFAARKNEDSRKYFFSHRMENNMAEKLLRFQMFVFFSHFNIYYLVSFFFFIKIYYYDLKTIDLFRVNLHIKARSLLNNVNSTFFKFQNRPKKQKQFSLSRLFVIPFGELKSYQSYTALWRFLLLNKTINRHFTIQFLF